MAIQTLEAALDRNKYPKGLMLHSDQGKYLQAIAMSRAGCPYGNSAMESFYGTLKAELIYKHRFSSDEELNHAIIDYAYVYYNHICSPSSNNYLTPFEKRMQA